jgi:hypothetical protein
MVEKPIPRRSKQKNVPRDMFAAQVQPVAKKHKSSQDSRSHERRQKQQSFRPNHEQSFHSKGEYPIL